VRSAQKGLQELQAAPAVVKVGGRELELRPIRFGQLHQVISMLGPVLADWGDEALPDAVLLQRHAERLVPLAALLTGQDRKWIEDLPLDEAGKLIAALVEANADFFVNRLAPALESAVSRISGRLSSLTPKIATPAGTSAGPTPPSG
jgi:hypothetical protein